MINLGVSQLVDMIAKGEEFTISHQKNNLVSDRL